MKENKDERYWLNTFRDKETINETTIHTSGYIDYLIPNAELAKALMTILSAISLEKDRVITSKKTLVNGELISNKITDEREGLAKKSTQSSEIENSLKIITKYLLPTPENLSDDKGKANDFQLPDMTEALKAISDVKRHVVLNVDEVPEYMTVSQVIDTYNKDKILIVSGKKTNNKISSKIY